MNAYLNDVRFNNTRYNENTRAYDTSKSRLGDGIINLICAIVAIVTCPAAVMLEKTAVVFALFLSAIAVVGAIENGIIPMFAGISICAIISLCEYGMLKSLWRRSAKTTKN